MGRSVRRVIMSAKQIFGLSISQCNEGLMSSATITQPHRQTPEYVTNPDMAAFTIGQIAIAALREDGALSVDGLRKHLARIALRGDDAAAARVSPDMAIAALRHIESFLQHEAA